MFEQSLCDVVSSILPDCIMETDIVSDWGMFPLLSIVKQKACKSVLQAISMGQAKWGPVRLHEPWYRIKVGMSIGTNALCDSPMCSIDGGLWEKTASTFPQWLLGLWTREFLFEEQLLACYWTWIKTITMTKGHKIILKPEILNNVTGDVGETLKCGLQLPEDFHNKMETVYTRSCYPRRRQWAFPP